MDTSAISVLCSKGMSSLINNTIRATVYCKVAHNDEIQRAQVVLSAREGTAEEDFLSMHALCKVCLFAVSAPPGDDSRQPLSALLSMCSSLGCVNKGVRFQKNLSYSNLNNFETFPWFGYVRCKHIDAYIDYICLILFTEFSFRIC